MSPTPVPGVGLVVVAAGRGERLGAGRPKALVQVAGRPLLVWALEGAAAAVTAEVVVVAPSDALDEVRALAPGAVVVAGADSRQASVAAGLAALPPVGLVLVHDAARAFVPPQVFAAVLDALRSGARAVVPGVAPADTLRHLDDGPVDRSRVVVVQTPQGFHRDVLERAPRGGRLAGHRRRRSRRGARRAGAGGPGIRGGLQGDASARRPAGRGPGPCPGGDVTAPLPRTGIGVDVHALRAGGVRPRAVGRRAALAR